MLQKLSDHIRDCYVRAASCAEEAQAATDEKLRADLLRMEVTWTKLAKSYEFVQALEAFLLDADRRRDEQRRPPPMVLIVEEMAPVLEMAKTCLAEHRYVTLSASTAAQALAIIEVGLPIQALITNIGLAEGGPQAGLELATKAAQKLPGLKVLFSTGYTITDDMRAAFAEGAAAVLEKPYAPMELVKALSGLLGRPLLPSLGAR